MIHFHCLIARFQESVLLIIQYKLFKSFLEDKMLQDLIFCTRWCGTGFISQHCWVVHFHLINYDQAQIFCTIWSGGNILYHLDTSFQKIPKGESAGFSWWVLQHCTGFARLVWGRLRVHRAFVYSDQRANRRVRPFIVVSIFLHYS